MFCQKCGASNEEANKFCQTCGASLQTNVNENQNPYVNNEYREMPSFNSGHSIFLIVFSLLCCGGIIGVIFAALSLAEGNKVNDYAAKGDYDNAIRCKNAANKWIKATYITWAVVAALMVLYFIFMVFVGVASSM